MALVESRHYDDDPALSRQVGQYTPPPPVRLQRSGKGRIVVAAFAALVACSALGFALYGTEPATDESGASVIALEQTPTQSYLDTLSAEAQKAAEQDAARKLAILANLAPPPPVEKSVFETLGVEELPAQNPVAQQGERLTEELDPPQTDGNIHITGPVRRAEKPSSIIEPRPKPQVTAAATGGKDTAQPAKPAGFKKVAHADLGPLNPAPYAPITENSINGLLPVVSPDGLTSRQYYARPFPAADTRPRVSLVVGGLGLSDKATEAAITQLPPEVTLAFAPYGKNLQSWINKARAAGHEVLLELPMEPFDYPANDPGPFTLLTKNDPQQNADRLSWLLAQFNGYVGVTNYLGAKFTATPEALVPVLRELDSRGLLVLDDGTSNRSQVPGLAQKLQVPFAHASRTIDLRASRSAIDDNLLDLERIAVRQGAAVGMGFAYPVTIDRIVSWAETLDDKGLVLAPITANLAQKEQSTQFGRQGDF